MAFNGELYQVFSHLPAKPLYKFATMAKPCLDYLSETGFMEKQCRNSLSKNDNVGFFIEENSSLWIRTTTFQLVPMPGNECSIGVPSTSLEFLKEKGRILGSSNGLLLCQTINSTQPTELFLCNPATRSWLPIALPSKEMARMCHFGMSINVVLLIGNNGSDNNKKFPLDYNLLLFENDYTSEGLRSTNVHVLDQEGNWVLRGEKINTGGRDLKFNRPVYCKDNCLYLLSDCGDYIQRGTPFYYPYVFCYDVRVGKSKTTLDLPEEARENFLNGAMCIFGWQLGENADHANDCFDSVCLAKSTGLLVSAWVLEDDTSSKSWRQVMMLDIERDLGINDAITHHVSFMVLGKKLVFATDLCVYSYSIEGSDCGKLEKVCDNKCGFSDKVRFNSYSTTLRPCQKDSIMPSRSLNT